jgi:hypothetical protein
MARPPERGKRGNLRPHAALEIEAPVGPASK